MELEPRRKSLISFCTFDMSASENSTIAPSSDFEGSLQCLDEYTGMKKPGDEASIPTVRS
jgi:hypothetical protein